MPIWKSCDISSDTAARKEARSDATRDVLDTTGVLCSTPPFNWPSASRTFVMWGFLLYLGEVITEPRSP
jgi:hypothetical protein